jgi:hypothetical protein
MSQTLTPEELQQFQDLRNGIYETISILGDLNYRKTLLDLELDSLKDTIKQNALKEREVLKEFGKKYGDGSINSQTGEITPV